MGTRRRRAGGLAETRTEPAASVDYNRGRPPVLLLFFFVFFLLVVIVEVTLVIIVPEVVVF
jgi:hypothetical protein